MAPIWVNSISVKSGLSEFFTILLTLSISGSSSSSLSSQFSILFHPLGLNLFSLILWSDLVLELYASPFVFVYKDFLWCFLYHFSSNLSTPNVVFSNTNKIKNNLVDYGDVCIRSSGSCTMCGALTNWLLLKNHLPCRIRYCNNNTLQLR